MTFPHIEPEFKKDSNVPYYLTQGHIKRVFDLNNAILEAWDKCNKENDKNINCFECKNPECFKLYAEKAKFDGITLDEYLRNWEKQIKADEEAAKAQKERYKKYYDDYYFSLIDSNKEKNKKSEVKKEEKQKNLFNF